MSANVGGMSAGMRRFSFVFTSPRCPQPFPTQGLFCLAVMALADIHSGAPADGTVRCRLCAGGPDAKGRERGQTWSCRVCETLSTMIHRNMGPGWLRELTAEARSSFFRKAKEAPTNGARYTWPVVRAVVVKKMTEAYIQHHESGVEVASKPKSVWLAQGYTEDQLSGCPHWTCPQLGEVYSVPTRTETLKEIYSRAEEKVLEQESALQAKSRGSAEPKDGEGGGGDDEELEVPKAPPAAGGGGGRKGNGGGKASTKALERKAAAEAKKATTAGACAGGSRGEDWWVAEGKHRRPGAAVCWHAAGRKPRCSPALHCERAARHREGSCGPVEERKSRGGGIRGPAGEGRWGAW